MRSLGRWLLVLLSMVFVAALLGSVGATRRPLPLAAIAVRHPARPVPLVERLLVLACLWSPMLMLLGLLQAERETASALAKVRPGQAAVAVHNADSFGKGGRRALEEAQRSQTREMDWFIHQE